MNAVSLDLIGACLPLALAIGYLPRLVRSLDAWTWMLLVGSLGISATFSFCDSKAVHVVPGIWGRLRKRKIKHAKPVAAVVAA